MSLLLLVTSSLLTIPPSTAAETQPAWLTPEPLFVAAPIALDSNEHIGGWYARINAGITTTSNSDGPSEEIDFDEGYLLGVAIGHSFGRGSGAVDFGIEAEGLWTDQEADTNGAAQPVRDSNVGGLLLNGTVDWRFAEQFSLYGAAGVGGAWVDVGTESDSLSDFDEEDGPFLAWQAKAGVAWHFGSRTALQFGYRFLNVDDVELDDDANDASFDLQTEQHVLELGIVFGF